MINRSPVGKACRKGVPKAPAIRARQRPCVGCARRWRSSRIASCLRGRASDRTANQRRQPTIRARAIAGEACCAPYACRARLSAAPESSPFSRLPVWVTDSPEPRGAPPGPDTQCLSPCRARAAASRTTAGGFLGRLQGGRQAGGYPAGTARPCSTLTGVCPAPFRLRVVRGTTLPAFCSGPFPRENRRNRGQHIWTGSGLLDYLSNCQPQLTPTKGCRHRLRLGRRLVRAPFCFAA